MRLESKLPGTLTRTTQNYPIGSSEQFLRYRSLIIYSAHISRINQVFNWKQTIESLLEKLILECHLLKDEKIETEKEVEKINIPMQTVVDCISIRDGRRCSELTYDDVSVELKNESCVVQEMKHLLTEKYSLARSHSTFHLNLLKQHHLKGFYVSGSK